jgi:AcrR family transcriptional regulator
MAAEQAGSGAPRADDQAGVPRRTKAAQTEATTAALIGAARELFASRGYAAVGTEEIVQQAGVTRGALYHHFRGGKEELFRAVLIQISAETAQRVAQAALATDDPWEALVLGSDAFLDACTTPEVQRIILTDGPSVLGWDAWRAIDTEIQPGPSRGRAAAGDRRRARNSSASQRASAGASRRDARGRDGRGPR